MELKNKKLALFFTIGVSLKSWNISGNLKREIKPYIFLSNYFGRIYFFTYGTKEEYKFKNELTGNIEILPRKTFLPVKIYQFFIPLIYRKQLKEIDIYKTNQMAASIPAILAKWIYKKKLIIRCGYEWLSFLKKKNLWLKEKIAYLIEKIAYKNANKIILTSKRDRDFVINKFKICSKKIKLVPNYIDTEIFKPLLNIPKEKNRIIFVGRLEKQKNLFNLIEAIAPLKVKLIIIGSGSFKKKLENFVREKKANVEFKGNIPNEKLPEELNKSEIFILPSFYEGCPKVLLEAMSCSLPCIGTDVEGINEIIKHKENGYLCETDAHSIRKAILEVLNNKNLQAKISQNARKTILENFSLEKILEEEIRIYETL